MEDFKKNIGKKCTFEVVKAGFAGKIGVIKDVISDKNSDRYVVEVEDPWSEHQTLTNVYPSVHKTKIIKNE